MLKLYFHPLSTFTRRVHLVLIEKRIPFKMVEIDMAARVHRAPAYRAINPYGRLPTIEEDGFVIDRDPQLSRSASSSAASGAGRCARSRARRYAYEALRH